jgi:inorganic triphosphatase YgiF
MSHEIELKLTLPQKSLAALRRHPLIADAPREGRTCTLENTYFDTLNSNCANAAWPCAPARPAAAGCKP